MNSLEKLGYKKVDNMLKGKEQWINGVFLVNIRENHMFEVYRFNKKRMLNNALTKELALAIIDRINELEQINE